MKKLRSLIQPRHLGTILYWLAKMITSTIRFEVRHSPPSLDHMIICSWHGRTFVFPNEYGKRNIWVIISHSNDGDIQKSIFERFGFHIIRGSTRRGGTEALVEAIRVLRKGGTLAVTPDGPKGPTHVVQGGVMKMAQKSGAPLLPGAFDCRRRWILERSWDRYLIPKPFTKGLILYGDPIPVPPDATDDELEVLRQKLQDELNRLEAAAESEMGHASTP